jgi:hypothetical protein
MPYIVDRTSKQEMEAALVRNMLVFGSALRIDSVALNDSTFLRIPQLVEMDLPAFAISIFRSPVRME